MFDKLLDFVTSAVREQERTKYDEYKKKDEQDFTVPRPAAQFWAARRAWELVEPCRAKAARHREREAAWTKRLEEAEKELMEKGITLDVFDSSTGTYVKQAYGALPGAGAAGGAQLTAASICSGAISMAGFTNAGNANSQQFQPRVDQAMLDAVKNAKSKLLEHRQKAFDYEKYARAFSANPEFTVRLGVDDCHYFGIGEGVTA